MAGKFFGMTACAAVVLAGVQFVAISPSVAAGAPLTAHDAAAGGSTADGGSAPQPVEQNCRRVGKSYFC